MKYQIFKIMKMVIAFLLAIIMAQAVIFSNYVLAIFAVVAAVAVIYVAKGKVKEIITDERDIQLAGKAARLALTIFAIAGAVLTFIFMFLRNASPVYEAVGSTLAYSTCALLLVYSVILSYYEKQN